MFDFRLECTECDWSAPPTALYGLCPQCETAPLLARWELRRAPELLDTIRSRPGGMWRFEEVLPFADRRVTLGEGSTPLLSAPALAAAAGMRRGTTLLVKDESRNPTRSFKSRGISAAITAGRALGATRYVIPTAGNAGAALAAYAARANVDAFVAMPSDTPCSIEEECLSYGARVERVEGVITDASVRCRTESERTGAFGIATLREPYRVEGKKTMGYELVLDLGGVPDVIVYPTGGGTGLIGMWKAFDEMERLGWIGPERPRMVAVQSEGCAPIVRAWQQGLDHAPEWSSPETVAWGLRVPKAVGDKLILRALRDSGGVAVAVEDDRINEAAARMRRLEGIDAGEESGAGLLALEQLVASGWVGEQETVILFNTGGDKYRG